MKHYILSFLLVCCMQMNAQDNAQVKFTPPFDFPLFLSGNFGELRANHFHGGLDFKTQGVSGKKVLAIADGYVSRIRVTHGSGYVIEVTYDNGYSTINRHLSGFVSPIAQRVEELQYANESWEVDITPDKNEYLVKAGQHIAWSGNTGYSFGPHLHLDMFEEATGDYIDPLPFFKKYLKDNRAPQVTGLMLFPKPGKGMVNRKAVPQTFDKQIKDTITAWGEVGAAIRAYDYMNEVNNRYGVHTVILTVDGEEIFRSVVDRFSENENRMINAWAYENKYMKSFIDPACTLRMLKAANGNRGWVTINEERLYHFRYTLKDAYGNATRYTFVVKGTPQTIEPVNHREKYIFRWDRMNYLQEPGLDLMLPRGVLYDDIALNYAVRADSGAVAFTYQLHDGWAPLHSFADIQIGVRHKAVEDTAKYYMARINKKGKLTYVGGKYKDGYVKARIRELGTYTVAIDTVAPEITAIKPETWVRTGKIVYKIKEEETGVKSYRGTIDGKYALFGRHIMNNRLEYKIDPKRIKKGGQHVVEITVVDHCGNKTVVRNNFNY